METIALIIINVAGACALLTLLATQLERLYKLDK